MDIRAFKMRTGEEIVCEVLERTEDTVTIKNPIMLINMPDKGPQMVGYFQTSCGEEKSDNEIKNRQFILTRDMYWIEGTPMSYIAQSYNQEFGAGIVVPDQGIVSAV